MEVPDNLTEAMIDMDAKDSEAATTDKENKSQTQNEAAANQPQSEAGRKRPMRFMLSGVVDEEKNK